MKINKKIDLQSIIREFRRIEQQADEAADRQDFRKLQHLKDISDKLKSIASLSNEIVRLIK